MAQGVRIWIKRKLTLDHLTFRQREMVEIGSAGLLSVFQRLAQAKGPTDGPAKPLTTGFWRTHRDGSKTWIQAGYAIQKARMGRGNRRNLFLSGQLLGGLKVRTVTDNRVYMAPDGRIRRNVWTRRGLRKLAKPKQTATNRDVAIANQRIEPWLVFSPANAAVVMAKAKQVFARVVNTLVKAA